MSISVPAMIRTMLYKKAFPETVSRTSSPVRIVRDQYYLSNIKGIYPCGEGAGYAGGITSAAMDGMKVAEAIIHEYHHII